MRKITLIFKLFLVVCGLLIGNINVWAASVQHFGGNEQTSWTTSSGTTGILPGSTVTLKGLVMTFGGSTEGTLADQWDWNSKNNGVVSNMPNAGTESSGVTSVAIGDNVPAFGGTYKFVPSTTGVLSIGVKGGGPGNTSADGKLYLVTVDEYNKIEEIVASKGGYNTAQTETYHLIAGKTYYFFQCATKSDRVTGYRLTLKNISYQTSFTKEVTAAGYATFSSAYPLDLDNISGATAYIVKADAASGDNIVITPQTGKVAANTGLILKGDAGTVTIPVAASGTDISATNKLVAVTADATPIAVGDYVLGAATDNSNVGLYRLTSATNLNKGQAYLPGGFSSVKVLNFIIEGETPTSVEAPAVAEAEEEGVLYNTAGQQVTADYKGIVIKNGKKYLNK